MCKYLIEGNAFMVKTVYFGLDNKYAVLDSIWILKTGLLLSWKPTLILADLNDKAVEYSFNRGVNESVECARHNEVISLTLTHVTLWWCHW